MEARAPLRIQKGDRLLIATTNAGKLREIEALLAGLPLIVTPLSALTTTAAAAVAAAPGETIGLAGLDALPAPDETGQTFGENARLKARYYAAATGLLTVAEDSGLEIDALDGAPGIYSARYPGATYAERFRNLYAEMAARGRSTSAARFVCDLALARPRPDGVPHAVATSIHLVAATTGWDRETAGAAAPAVLFEARGTVEGEIAPAPRGSEGFGYDPIFYYPPFGQTLAEAAPDDKARVSHRGAAFRQLRAFLERAVSASAT
jgi:XTP/dITP diphosphohydrolase